MKLIRSSKCSFKFATASKLQELRKVLSEYGRVCNIFIDYFWKNGAQLGLDTESLIERIKRCQHGSNGQKQARRAFKQRIDEVVQEIVKEFKHIDLVVVEALKNMNYKSKLKRRLSKNMRRSIGTWAYRYWLKRLEMACETNRVSFRTVAPFYTSQTCPSCGHVDRGNRVGQMFRCLSCGHTGNADVVGARNILARFLTGLYGARYKPYEVMFNFL